MTRNILAFLGMPGSGKTEAIEYVRKTYGFPKVYFGDITFDEMRRRQLETTPENERLVRESLRNEYGEDYYAREVVRRIQALSNEPCILVESLYSWTEYETLKLAFGDIFTTITVHAAPPLRYARLSNRKERPLTREEAMNRDIAQLKRLDQGMPIALSDIVISNDTDLEHFHEKIDAALKTILKEC